MTPDTMVILVILCTGMRVSEAIDLRQDDLDEIKLTLRVDSSYSRTVHDSKAPKTKNSYRTIPIPKFLLQIGRASCREGVWIAGVVVSRHGQEYRGQRRTRPRGRQWL